MKSLAPSLTKLIIFVVVTLAATGLLAITIANTGFEPTTAYTARFTDAMGLNPGDDVRIAGVKVGEVKSIRIADRKQAEVKFDLYGNRRLPTSVNMTIKYRNLAGQRYVSVEHGPGGSGALLPANATIPVSQTHPALNLTVLFNGFQPLFQALSPDDVNKLSYEMIRVLQGEGGTIDGLLAHTASLTSTIANRDQAIGQVITNLNQVLGTVNARSDQTSTVIIQMQQLVSGLAADRRPIGDAISGIGDLTQATTSLLADSRQPLREDIDHLGQLSQNLDDNQQLLDRFVSGLPNKLNMLIRTGSYGSWFNFYQCRISGTVGVSRLNVQVPVDSPGNMPARCQ